jgi:hypothetical protein
MRKNKRRMAKKGAQRKGGRGAKRGRGRDMGERKEKRKTYRTKRRAVATVDTRRKRNSGARSRVTFVAVGVIVHVLRHCCR